MKISQENKGEILAAISECFMELTDEAVPEEELELTPDDWSDETKKSLDILAKFESKVQAKVKAVLNT